MTMDEGAPPTVPPKPAADAWLLSLFTSKPSKAFPTEKVKKNKDGTKQVVAFVPRIEEPDPPCDAYVVFATRVQCLCCGTERVISSGVFARYRKAERTIHYKPKVDPSWTVAIPRLVEWRPDETEDYCYRCFDVADRLKECIEVAAAGQTVRQAPLAESTFNLENLFEKPEAPVPVVLVATPQDTIPDPIVEPLEDDDEQLSEQASD